MATIAGSETVSCTVPYDYSALIVIHLKVVALGLDDVLPGDYVEPICARESTSPDQ